MLGPFVFMERVTGIAALPGGNAPWLRGAVRRYARKCPLGTSALSGSIPWKSAEKKRAPCWGPSFLWSG